MRVLITGATGFIGRYLVPYLSGVGHDLLLVGRNREKIATLYSGIPATDYEHLLAEMDEIDFVVHLAAVNNDRDFTLNEFRQGNLDLTKKMGQISSRARVKGFINVTSLHAMEKSDHSHYSKSKREGEEALASIADLNLINIRLPAVYADTFRGNLSILNKIPPVFRKVAFLFLASLKPTVSSSVVCTAINDVITKRSDELGEIIVSDKQINNPVYHGTKRLVDLLFVAFVFIFFWWLLLGAWLAVKLSSPGGGIFGQVRVGQYGERFVCYKFRTMARGTKQVGTHDISASAITPVGKVLRRTKIDELPQIWNILRNQISLVGPRPCLPTQDEVVRFREKVGAFDAKPGISGLAQIQEIDMSTAEKLANADGLYISTRSTLLDLKIILATVLGKGQGDRVSPS